MTPATQLIEIDGQPYTLTFNFGMARLAEYEIGKHLITAISEGVSLDTLSAGWWASLQRKHCMTRDAADNLVDAAGMAEVAKWITEGLTAYFGASDDADEGNVKKAAPKRK